MHFGRRVPGTTNQSAQISSVHRSLEVFFFWTFSLWNVVLENKNCEASVLSADWSPYRVLNLQRKRDVESRHCWAALLHDAGHKNCFKNTKTDFPSPLRTDAFRSNSRILQEHEQNKTNFLCLWRSTLYFCASFRDLKCLCVSVSNR